MQSLVVTACFDVPKLWFCSFGHNWVKRSKVEVTTRPLWSCTYLLVKQSTEIISKLFQNNLISCAHVTTV